jgi:hypothetical protein
MPRHPIGDQAMTDAERQRKRRERLRLGEALAVGFERLERQLADKASQRPAKGTALDDAKAQIKRLTQELRIARNEILWRSDEIEKLKAKKIVKSVKVPLDPDSEAARRIDALKKENKTLQAEADKRLMRLKTLVPAGVKTKIAKALTEQTTSPQNRLDALQAWNGLGLNNIGK